uniref:Uncharacterized protein n=1 Tax=Acrobeloides nanus TaxID=290746 RepID=A0A914DLX0_9BILA
MMLMLQLAVYTIHHMQVIQRSPIKWDGTTTLMASRNCTQQDNKTLILACFRTFYDPCQRHGNPPNWNSNPSIFFVVDENRKKALQKRFAVAE